MSVDCIFMLFGGFMPCIKNDNLWLFELHFTFEIKCIFSWVFCYCCKQTVHL